MLGDSRDEHGIRAGQRFVSARASALVLDILADPAARIPGFGLQTPFEFPFPAAVKSGTSRHFTDNWAVATTGAFTVAAWIGNFGGEPMQGVSGVSGAGPLLHRAVMLTANRYPPGTLPSPGDAGLVALDVCRLSGLRSSGECPTVREWFIPGSEPDRADDWVRDGRVALPAEYAEWAAQDGRELSLIGERVAEPVSAADSSDGSPSDTATVLRIVAPLDGDVYRIAPGVPVEYSTIRLLALGAAGQVRWFVDGRPLDGDRWTLAPGSHLIRAEAAGVRRDVRIRVE
jgi:penicillin-binding protein 1C